jgi:hypothetical protein
MFSHPSTRDFHLNIEKITHHAFFNILNAFKASGINSGQLKINPKFKLVSGILLNQACCIMKIMLDGKGHRNSYVRKRRWGVHGVLYRKGAMVLYLLL